MKLSSVTILKLYSTHRALQEHIDTDLHVYTGATLGTQMPRKSLKRKYERENHTHCNVIVQLFLHKDDMYVVVDRKYRGYVCLLSIMFTVHNSELKLSFLDPL